MQLEEMIRVLARSSYWQNLYLASKDTDGIHLFTNVNRFSGMQNLFLYWLRVYSMLYDDLSTKETPFITQKVIDDNIRCDAYLYYRKRKFEQEMKKHNQSKRASEAGVKTSPNTNFFEVEVRHE